MPQTMAKAASGFCPDETAAPTSFISCAKARPWLAIHIVPGEHDDSDEQDGGVEQLLASAFEQGAELTGEGRDHGRASNAAKHAIGDPEAAACDTLGRGEHDADDQSGLNDFAEDDEERCKHRLLGDDHAFGSVFVIFADEGIFAGIERPQAHSA